MSTLLRAFITAMKTRLISHCPFFDAAMISRNDDIELHLRSRKSTIEVLSGGQKGLAKVDFRLHNWDSHPEMSSIFRHSRHSCHELTF